MAVQVPGLIAIIVFYILIAAVGIVAGRKRNKEGTTEELFVANRNLGLVIASLTIAATNVGGGYITGTAEALGRDGFVWCIGPIGYSVGMCIAGLFFAPKARRAGHTTILDIMQIKYGNKMGALCFVPELCGNVFWIASTLAALGTTLSIILDINMVYSIVVSAAIAVGYTFFGGLFSVAYTDVIQLFFMFLGLVVAIPFSVTNPVVDLTRIADSWTGSVPTSMIGLYLDTWCMLCLGGVPWQAIYQRALACRTPAIARKAMLIASFLSLTLSVPPAAVGVVGKATDWNMTEFDGEVPLTYNQWAHIFPMVLQFVCPKAVSVIGIGAVSAAVMSSADSCVLATGSLFTHNIYNTLIRTQASERELIWILRVSMLVTGVLGTSIALSVQSVYGLFIMAADLMYVLQFPQFLCAMWIPFTNVYGSLAGYLLALFLRIAGGEPYLRIPALLKYPWFDETSGQLFPFKTFSMAVSLIVIVLISCLFNFLFESLKLDTKYDFLNGYKKQSKSRKNNCEIIPLNFDEQIDNDSTAQKKDTEGSIQS